ncbi:MAG: hypothetical protein GY769_25385, partial [bacterium]|nr:hypothetical protein [bacterium]
MSDDASKCPVTGGSHSRGAVANQRWWPNQLGRKMLQQNPPSGEPVGGECEYAEEFKKLGVEALKKDLRAWRT